MSAVVASYWLWAIWYVAWWIPALWSPRAASRPPRGTSNLDRLATLVGVVLLFWTPTLAPGHFLLCVPMWRTAAGMAWVWVAGMAAGFAFCWWARVHLGRLWSGLVTAKADHRIVDTGPYGLVRHPIYSGVMASAVCLGLLKATPLALLGAVLVIAGFWLTARKEERFLREALGAEGYDAYSRRVGMLMPFLH
ncbi:MAG: isoprenylcysteine carboxylmethyltransferase family protein [Caulobacteraceae bacterium]